MMHGRRVQAALWNDMALKRAFNTVSIPTSSQKRGLPQLRPDQFKALAGSCLARVEGALEPLLPPVNTIFHVSRTSNPDALVVTLAAHEFQLTVLAKTQKIELVSPVRSYEETTSAMCCIVEASFIRRSRARVHTCTIPGHSDGRIM
ncbi:hypothetical protein, variant 1 [Aphanomyces astaci]|uniref:Uncharacterized protein n=1 Tax=Aphanomyces astaci TaxID=112090 RepID=W4FJ18_APHAT|nr:hypothetical protein, variant 1 [Aphanomyces astaci]ETV66728.1 hypothetical protein, variant 1 [Aphanomyces astaci]|eukprot:XP_009843705.1 hypothetical protein, variant 1 [Aphanomyces astaci]